jgi:hypothetical protein
LSDTDEQRINDWNDNPSPSALSQKWGIDVRNVHAWRRRAEGRYNIELRVKDHTPKEKIPVPKKGYRRHIEIRNAEVFVGSDLHEWPGERSVAFDAFIKLIQKRRPALVVLNGDSLDGSKISRHPPGGWADLPDLADELAAVQERMGEVEVATPEGVPLVFPVGNHDSRFSASLAQKAPDFIKINGTDLSDHLPAWNFCWSIVINNEVWVKHRWHQGVHASWNNVLKSGKTMVTGHTHRLGARAFIDYNDKVRWGIECGTLMEISTESDKLTWTEDNPLDWHPGFVVLTFDENGQLQEPDICRVINGRVRFRGEYI